LSSEPPAPRTPQPIRIGGGWTFVYAILAVAFAGTGIFLFIVRHAPLTSPQVLVSALGAVWFTARAAMSLTKRG
jgi:hypothetical protein